jgi:tRNA1Val (adenine37-N6)-methyltransferase
MANSYFQFRHFIIQQDKCAMKVTTDACLFGAWVANEIKTEAIRSKNLLDIGTGTGLLSLMIAQKNAQLSIDAIEIDTDAYEQARENISTSEWQGGISIFNDDARNFSFGKKYDLVISNPPFYENELTSADAKKNKAQHSSELSLEGLLKLMKENGSLSGSCYLLMSYKREKEIKKLLQQYQLFIAKEVWVRQSVHHGFFRIMISCNRENKNQIEKTELSIWNEKREYTNEFVQLLKDYYLFL